MQVQTPATEHISGPDASLRLGLNVGLLSWEARFFYLEAVGTAVRRNDRWTLDRVPPAEELAQLLEIATGSERVVEIGAQTGWTALALAVSDERRSVISFRRPGASQGPGRYAHLVDASVRARVGSREQRVERVPGAMPGPADLAHVDLSQPYADMYAALVAAGLIVRPGGLVVARGGRVLETRALIEELDLEATVVDGMVVGRVPLEVDWAALLEQAIAPSPADLREFEKPARSRRLRMLALGLAGSLVGAGAGLVLPLGDSPVTSDHGAGGNSALETSQPPSGAKGPRAAASSHSTAASASSGSTTASAQHHSRKGITAFSGTGTKRLGTIRVDEPVFMRWHVESGSFRIVSEAWGFRPRTRDGRLLLSPGAYRRFEVKGEGRWRLELAKP
jgi:hypothetical protein